MLFDYNNIDTSYLQYDRIRKNRERKAKMWLKIRTKMLNMLLMSFLVGLCIYLFYYPHIRDVFASGTETGLVEEEPAILQPSADSATTTKEVKIEVVMSQERMIQEIHKIFWDAPIMVKVAHCEGIKNGKLDNQAYNPTNGSGDTGIFQISEKYHGKEYRRLGFTNMGDFQQNLAYARILYERNGLSDWEASRHCWSK